VPHNMLIETLMTEESLVEVDTELTLKISLDLDRLKTDRAC
jgi:hypothetical protein